MKQHVLPGEKGRLTASNMRNPPLGIGNCYSARFCQSHVRDTGKHEYFEGYPLSAQRHCDIYLDSVTFKRLRDELEAYETPIMLICEEGDSHDLIRRRLVSALHSTEKSIVDMRVPDGRFYREELVRCCKIARETDTAIILAYGLGAAIKYARAVSTCAWSESDPWQKYHFNVGSPALKRIPFAHVFTSLEHYDEWEQVLGVSFSSTSEPDFAIQVTSAIY